MKPGLDDFQWRIFLRSFLRAYGIVLGCGVVAIIAIMFAAVGFAAMWRVAFGSVCQ